MKYIVRLKFTVNFSLIFAARSALLTLNLFMGLMSITRGSNHLQLVKFQSNLFQIINLNQTYIIIDIED